VEPSGKLERAYLAVSEPASDGAKVGGGGDRIPFSFNPKEISITRTAEWKSANSKKAAMPEYVGTKPASMTLEMFFDASEGGDVTKDVDRLLACMEPHAKTEKDKPSPPFVSFGWGKVTYLEHAVVKSVAVKYTRFRSDGAPIRATATVTLEELRPPAKRQNPTSGSEGVESERVVGPGDTLALVAFQELGSTARWRDLAAVNGIDDPFRVPSGRRLVIPAVHSLPRGS
jgi:nucleoid-associated protein YgaU